MSAVNDKRIKWQQIAGIGVICGLAVAGCSRSNDADDNDNDDAVDVTEQPVIDDSAVASAINCNDPMVQDRLRNALKNTLNQQAQTIAANYANEAEISLDSGLVSNKANGILIDVQNAAILQPANGNGMTTCQASVSMTLSSEDLYQASQISAANNQASLPTRLSQNNIRINNNMLVDDAFTYVVGTQGGQVQTRIAGQPALMTVVADVVASSALQSSIDTARAQRPVQETPRRNSEQNRNQNDSIPQPSVTQPVEPVQPTPVPTIKQDNGSSSAQNSSNPSSEKAMPAQPKAQASVPTDDSIDMVIIEDGNATY